MTFRAGLIVGKFCPLHRGHQLLIDTARAACARLVIVSYAKPGFAGCERAVREGWLRALYPDAVCLVVDDAWLAERAAGGADCPWREVPHDDEREDQHRRFTAWLCHDVLGEVVDAVFTSEDYGDGFAQVVSDWQRGRGGPKHTVHHVCVDQARSRVPVSGTLIRQDPWAWAEYLAPQVRASFVRRVAVLGAESTGKTTLCAALARRLGTAWVPEYGRELWVEKGGALEFPDMLQIGRIQVDHEERAALGAHRWLVCDTAPLTTRFYSEAMFGRVDPELARLAGRAYDHILLCLPEFDFVQDGTRQDTAFRDRQHAWYVDWLKTAQVPVSVLSGTLEQRVELAAAALAA